MEKEKQDRLFEFIKHGDEEHKRWLKEAINCFFKDKKLPVNNDTKTFSLGDKVFLQGNRVREYVVIGITTSVGETYSCGELTYYLKNEKGDSVGYDSSKYKLFATKDEVVQNWVTENS